MAGDPVRLGVVGLGRWAAVLAKAAARSERVKVVAGYSRSAEKREAFARAFGGRAVASYAALLRDPEVEAVVVTTPNHEHATPICEAAAAGKPVFVDKPIAHTLADALKIRAAVAAAGIVFTVGHSARRLEGVRAIRRAMGDSTLGQPVMGEANFSNERGLQLLPDKWRYYRDKSPGGPLIQLGVHHADTLLYLFGPLQAVTAMKRRLYTPAEVDDVTMTILEFQSGCLCYIGSAWACPGVFYLNVYGTRANLFYDVDFTYWQESHRVDEHSSLRLQKLGEAGRAPVALGRGDMLREELEEFAACVRTGARPEVGADEAIRALAVVEAAIRAADSGQTVPFKAVLPE